MKGKGKRRDVSAYLDYCASRVDPADVGHLDDPGIPGGKHGTTRVKHGKAMEKTTVSEFPVPSVMIYFAVFVKNFLCQSISWEEGTGGDIA